MHLNVSTRAPLLLLGAALACAPDRPATTGIDVYAERAAAARKTTPPGTPTGVAATAGDARATVTWTAPPAGKWDAATSYRVVSNPAAAVVTVSAPTTTAVVTGLTNGTTYTFTVTASNAAGSGPVSAPSNPVTPEAAPPPPPPPPPSGSGRWLSGYYVGYQRQIYPPSEIDFGALTHIIVGRIRPLTSGAIDTTFDVDNVNGPAMARDVSARAHAAGRKAILMIGGAGEYNGFVGAASSTNRARFVASLLKAMDDFGYDGVDIDWEPIQSTDEPNALALLQELRAARPGMLLTMPVGWANTNFPQWTSAIHAQFAQYVDQLNIMTYDMAGPWSGWVSWHNSALSGHGGDHPSSAAGSVQVYRNMGIAASKLGIGIPFYGSCWRGPTGPLQSLSGATYVGSDNTMSWSNIMASYYTTAAERWDASAQVPYLSFATATGPSGCTFVSYENVQSVTAKGDYVRNNGLGGAIVWTIAQGYQASAPIGQRNALLTAAYAAIAP